MKWFRRLFGLGSDSGERSSEPIVNEDSQAMLESLQLRYAGYYLPAIHLRQGESNGFSRLGGLPSMPYGMEWPSWQNKPQAFLAQLDLGAMGEALPSFLPDTGYLYFFYDQDQGEWGFDPNDFGAWRVLYVQGDPSGFLPYSVPEGLAEESIYRPKAVVPQRIELLPDSLSLPKAEWDWDREGDAYDALRLAAFEGQPLHQVLGYPSPVQDDDMEVECQLASNGIYMGSPEGHNDPRIPELKKEASDWKLLLQLDSDEETGWMWGDSGVLYFWIRESDARKGDFSKVWLVLQCC
ncbi:conserved domain protein [Verrucomicrobiia bacterium DG1235]|nr:conserved domain protein [Verrucomicrobiae bacterium DG1235]